MPGSSIPVPTFVIVRHGKFIIPKGGSHIEDGDDIIVVTTGNMPVLDLNDIYED